MSEQNRWSETQTDGAWSRDSGRYGRASDDNRGFYGTDRDRSPYAGSNQPGRYGEGRFGRYGYDQARSGNDQAYGYGTERYGAAPDYNLSGPQSGYGSEYYGQSAYGEDRYSQGGRGYGDRSRGRDFAADRYQFGDGGRPQEDRSWWDQKRDQVSSWFGDDEAMRRHARDEQRAGEHRGRGPKGYVRSDDRIREDVNDRLTDHGHLDASDIDVSVSGAEVTLGGTVHRREDKRRAEDIADGVSGVKHVQNNLRIKDAAASEKTGSFGSAATASTGGHAGGASQAKTN